MRKSILLLLGIVFCCVSCSKNEILLDLKNTVWSGSSNSYDEIGLCVHTPDKPYCSKCYGWTFSRDKSASYYVFRENNVGYFADHIVEYWRNKEGAPYYDVPDRSTIKIYTVCYDYTYPDLYIFRSVGTVKECTDIGEALAYMKAQHVDVSKCSFNESPTHYSFEGATCFGSFFNEYSRIQ